MQGAPEAAPKTLNPSTPPTREGFAPLPLRARGVLEILDTAIKVYKQYFWVLIGWSAIVSCASQIQIMAFFLWPLIIGACVCCITAAVRGQNVQFKQCGQFSYPRYGRLIGTTFFAGLVLFIGAFVIVMALVLAGFGLLSVLQGLPLAVQITLGVTLFLAAVVAISMATVWLNLALIVVCMEEGKSGSRAMGRSFELLRGYWIRVCTLITLLSFGMLVLMAILWGFGMVVLGVGSIPNLLKGESLESLLALRVIGSVVSALLGTFFNPILFITLGLFYLDLRIRKEALDIEWGAHISVQGMAAENPGLQPPSAVWAPGSDLTLQQGEPSFHATLNSAAPAEAPWYVPAPGIPGTGNPGQSEQVTRADQQAWLGTPPPPPVAPEFAANPAVSSIEIEAAPATGVFADPSAIPPLTSAVPTVAEPTAAPAAAMPPAPPATQTLVCPHCGSTSPANQAFCMNCGSRLQQPGDSLETSAGNNSPTW